MTSIQRMKVCIIVYVQILLSVLTLSSCVTVPDGNAVSSKATNIFPSSTTTISPIPSQTQMATETPLPTWTMTTTPSPTDTNTPTPTASLTSTPFPDGYVLFKEDFENGVEELVLEGGKSAWQIQEDGEGNHFLCNVRSKPGLNIRIGDQHWQNYQLEFDVKDIEFVFNGSQILPLYVRKNANAHYLFLMYFVGYKNMAEGFSAEVSHVAFGKTLHTGEVLLPILLEDLEEPVENQWYTVNIKMDEGDISFYWDDELVIDYHDEEYLPDGAISFFVMYGNCLDNIKVTNIGKVEQ